jgi:choline-sulfatase
MRRPSDVAGTRDDRLAAETHSAGHVWHRHSCLCFCLGSKEHRQECLCHTDRTRSAARIFSGNRPIIAQSLVLLLAIILAAACGGRGRPVIRKTFPNAPIILISIDTLRADHLPAWGYDGVKTPNIDRLVRDGVIFRNAYSHCPLTLPSHVTLLTGKLPVDTGVRDNIGYRFASPDGMTLPEILRRRGYATAAAVSAYVLRGETGLRTIFDSYDDQFDFEPGAGAGEIERPGTLTAASAERWIEKNDRKPFFFFLHVYEPHAPYHAPEPFRSASRTPYDAEIAYADSIVGSFLDRLRARGDYDRSIIVLLSDHGEGLGDHGEREHGVFLYREVLHVPLVIKLPGNSASGSSIDDPVGLIDLVPTLARLCGLPSPAGLRGSDMFGARPATPVFSESQYARLHFGWSDLRSLISGERHYIEAPRAELYAFRSDPRESNNIASEDRRHLADFRKAMESYPRNLTAPAEVSDEERAKLNALGYIATKAPAAAGSLPDPKDRLTDLALYDSATESIAGGDLAHGASALEQVVGRNPNFTDAALRLADLYEKLGRSADAVGIYRDVLQRNPVMVEQAAIGIATAYLNMRQFPQARAHAELARGANPGGAAVLLAKIAMASGDPRNAEAEGQSAMRDPHYLVPGALVTADALVHENRAEAALELLDRVAAGRPMPRGFGSVRADAFVRLQRVGDAIASLREEIRLYPGERDAYAQLAALHLLQHDESSANEAFELMALAIPSPESAALAAATFQHFGYSSAAQRWRSRSAAQRQR